MGGSAAGEAGAGGTASNVCLWVLWCIVEGGCGHSIAVWVVEEQRGVGRVRAVVVGAWVLVVCVLVGEVA